MKKLIAATIATLLTTGILTGCAGAASASTAPSSTAASAASESASVSEAAAEETQIDKALALINTFATGDTDTARSLLADDYIQHNLAYGTGADAFVGSVEYLASAEVKTTVQNIRAFEDGDKVFLRPSTTLPAQAIRWRSTSSALMKTARLQSTGTTSPP